MKNSSPLTHVYYVPGMCAKPTIFEHIHLPKDHYITHWIAWREPLKHESIEAYAKRLCDEVTHENVILIGVSLGGLVVQEMQKFISVKKIVLISSIKTKHELSTAMKIARATKLYKLIPMSLVKYLKTFEKWPLGRFIKGRLHIYNKYIGIDSKRYMQWGIREVVNWQRTEVLPNIIHIAGDKDHIFPLKHLNNCTVVKGGTHLMIIMRFRWFNEHLPQLLADENQLTQK